MLTASTDARRGSDAPFLQQSVPMSLFRIGYGLACSRQLPTFFSTHALCALLYRRLCRRWKGCLSLLCDKPRLMSLPMKRFTGVVLDTNRRYAAGEAGA